MASLRAFVFPGQGSQSVGMGKVIAEASREARAVFEEVDEALGQNLFRLMCEGPQEALTLTENAQPAIMAHSIALLRASGLDLKDAAFCAAGHSLGEYSALCASGAIDLSTTARLLRLRGRAMQAAVPVGEGAMAALLGASLEIAQQVADEAAAGETCVVANDNDPGQVVLSGHRGAIDRAVEGAKEKGARRAVILPVSAPFHSPLMQPAAEAMEAALADASLTAPAVQIYANVTAAPTMDPDEIRRLLVEQVTGMVRWRESVIAMAEGGADWFIELGAKVLGPMIKRTAPDSATTSVTGPDEVDSLLKSL